jgi:hypothetical protein
MSTAHASWTRKRRWSALLVGLLSVIALFAGPVTAYASEGTLLTLVNENSGLCMSLPGDVVVTGARIDQWECGIYPDQYWYWNPSASRPGWYYLQPQQNDTLCATYVPGKDTGLTLQSCGVNAANGNFNTQLWSYDAVSGELQTTQGWAMSIPGASVAHNVNVITWPYGPYPDQSWGAIFYT